MHGNVSLGNIEPAYNQESYFDYLAPSYSRLHIGLGSLIGSPLLDSYSPK
ncbi:hypothetical protein SAMN05428975_3123 [Mucilaginibacter sp. OK268]|nr:hypothetical protein SAMN05428975_3123 [Mucilaginibacter sp. OK268]